VGRQPIVAAPSDAEAAYVKSRYGDRLQVAMNHAIAALSPEQRNLLKLHFVDGLTFDEMAERLGSHRVTVWRHIAAAREAISEGTRRQLLDESSIPASEFESIVRVIHSQLHLSLGQI
jgi:RNA polymerase sigma-70 factor (ECF subfamily)